MYGGGGAVEEKDMFLEAEHGGGSRRGVGRAGDFGVATTKSDFDPTRPDPSQNSTRDLLGPSRRDSVQ